FIRGRPGVLIAIGLLRIELLLLELEIILIGVIKLLPLDIIRIRVIVLLLELNIIRTKFIVLLLGREGIRL
ncbi:hypothetical protein OFB58_24650, partial [Escherichia coli]|nr:hypothetical protein [Escherichia coli]